MGELVDDLNRDIDRGINEDGSLRPGIYTIGDIPEAIWTEEERELIGQWTMRQFNIPLGTVRDIEVGKQTVVFVLYHLDAEGHKHVESDCLEDGSEDYAHVYVDKRKLSSQ